MGAAWLILAGVGVLFQEGTSAIAAEGPSAEPIRLSATLAWDWQPAGEGGRAFLLRGRCRLQQGDHEIQAQQAVIWVQASPQDRSVDVVRAYFEDEVQITEAFAKRSEPRTFVEWHTSAGLEHDFGKQLNFAAEQDPLYRRAKLFRDSQPEKAEPEKSEGRVEPREVTREKSAPANSGSQLKPLSGEILPTGGTLHAEPEKKAPVRRLRFFSRSAVPFNFVSFEDAKSSPPEQIGVFTGGVNLVVDGVEGVGTLDLRADHMVIWTQAVGDFNDQSTETWVQSGDAPLQIYLESNIVVLQGTTRIRAHRAFFDIRENRAVLQQVEVRTQSAELPMGLRIRADEVRQLSLNTFHAQQAWVSTSKFGKPGYKLAASDIIFEQRPSRGGVAKVGGGNKSDGKNARKNKDIQLASNEEPIEELPPAGLPETETTPWITTVNPTFQVEDTPVFWWPYVSAPASLTSTPLRKINFGNDRVFGAQLKTAWDIPQLFGREAPAGVESLLLADLLSERGPAVGTATSYQFDDPWGIGGPTKGLINSYLIHDDGQDNLGADRRALEPESQWRDRFQWRHSQQISDTLSFQGEFNSISDRNFLEQFYEQEWDTAKDNETALYLKQQQGDSALSIFTRARINDFDTTSEWLPRADGYVLGKSFFDGLMNWSSHSSAGYAHLRPGATPDNPLDVYTPLPYVADLEGAVMMSRHEVSVPLKWNGLNVVPYALGEAAYWGQGLTGSDVFRLYGSAGVRGSFLVQKEMPDVENTVFGLRGLLHQMTFDFDYSYSDSSQPLSDIAQYNEFDDQAQLRFRNRLVTNTFGGILPTIYDPRLYALRAGSAHNVTASAYELVDTQEVLRLGWRHRLQTQTGPYDNPRLRDWMTLDLEASFFPKPNRDNFGEAWGLLNGRYAWNFSERTSLLANASYDLFDDAPHLWSVGLLSQRSERGSIYVGVREIHGAGLDSRILTGSYSYQLTDKWVSTLGTAYDLAENRNRGQSLTLTRVGADWLFHLGASYDASRNNVGVNFAVEPRFFPGFGSSPNSQTPQLGSFLR